MKSYLQTIALATLLAAGAVFAQSPTPSGTQRKPAPSTSGQADPKANPQANSTTQPTPAPPGRTTNAPVVNIQINDKEIGEQVERVMQNPELEKKIEQHVDRIIGQINPSDWKRTAELGVIMSIIVPLAFFGLVALVCWWSFRRNRERMDARLAMHNALLAKFNSGAEFTDFVSSRGGQEYIEQLTKPQQHGSSANLVRSTWIGYVFTLMGAGMILVKVVEGSGHVMGGVVLLAIGVGHLMSVRAAQKMAERMGPQINSNGPAGGASLSPSQRVE
jgi:hypothetical protein